ncbi:N-acyl homoserine lactonase [Ascidiaceihabitans donghaensis]|uniref:N-acyl homoserine lactonase n=1 Tax=Ascidiaceihabitans donghaensis TaxID=1510460 RepID=A0A2R8BAP9_9RHOB|nr:MBL fold metallo-hydrolase [Ascidiaceihabitans donghaensis]SPH20117.1 N-acyl homoserine lactonase [Ascidiaceihabitans donghaensis]
MLCKIGDIEIWRLLEINGPFLDPLKLFPNAGPDVSARIEKLVPGAIDAETGAMILPVQGFLLKTPDHVVLVDGCVGNDKTAALPAWNKRQDGRFMAALTAAGVTPAQVDFVLCTHLHTDHVGWNTQLQDGRWVPTFPNAKYLMPSADEAVFRATASDTFTESVLPVIEAGQAELVQAGHTLGDYITLMPTPGHTPGHVSIGIKHGATQAVITGDALHTTAQCWHPEWHFSFDMDADLAETSRRQLLETASETHARIIGSHFKLPSIGHIGATGDGFFWTDD